MTLTVHDQVVVGFGQSLKNLSALLDKAAAHAAANKFDPNVLLTARLFPDMFALARQVQLATDFAKGAVARLAGIDPPKWDDTETTVDELQARIKKALDFLNGFTVAQFQNAETRSIEIKTPVRPFSFTGKAFLLHWAVPNFYFHVTTAYNLLRHNGVPIGKFDFLGEI
ncbi:MAG: DUF1993 domain-containing protein [Gammaproteobacteria bacterium]|nr:DUF1993 domain-containing protein [Gammaproteobacteria bacterium]